MRRLVVLAGLAAVLVSATGCGGTTPGQPTGVATAGGGPSTSASESNSLPVNQACSLFSSADLEQVGVSSPPTQEMVGTGHSCDFNSDSFAMGITIRTNVGLAGFVVAGTAVHDMTIGSHQAKQAVDNTGSCVIALGVSDSSRVDVTVTGDGTTDPCPTALTLAKMVEPRLP